MNLVIDLGFAINWDQPESTIIRVINDTLVTGYRKSKGWANNQQVYFAATFSKPMTGYTLFETGLDNPCIKTVEGKYTEAIFSFGNNGG